MAWPDREFMLVGGLGLVVHLAVLRAALLVDGGRFDEAQAAAVALTIAVNFTINNRFTYRDRRLVGRAYWSGLASFYLVCSAGAATNLWISNLVYAVHLSWWLAGATGAAASAILNYTASSLVTWRA